MMDFKVFGKAVEQQFQLMIGRGLFRSEVTKDELWDTYLGSFPPGSNPIFKQRTEHDCQCCRSFIRTVGGLVSIVNGQIQTIWDIEIGGAYQEVANAMATLVRSKAIDNVFLHTERRVGVATSYVSTEVSWNHFCVELPASAVCKGIDIGTKQADTRSTHDVMYRGLSEITLEAIDTTLELIAQNSIYRGEEQKFAVEEFRKLKRQFDRAPEEAKHTFCWARYSEVPATVSRIRNTAIGTLLVDLSEGKDLEDAVKAFDVKMAPTNYKRPTALVTKAMIQKAQEKIEELGLTSALERRYATIEDITINNILFADRTAKKAMNVFDELAAKVPEKTKNLDKIEEVSISNFIENILPKATSIEALFENRHAQNLVSLIAPVDPNAKSMFKWGNKFSWSYAGELADSIKERVKRAGGKVDGDLRCSLSWFNFDDLDLHLHEPGTSGAHIYYANKVSSTGGHLDVDMNAGHGSTRSAVENICYPDRSRMKEGVYKLAVNNFCARESNDVGFDVELEFDGVIHSFSYAKRIGDHDTILVAKFKYSHGKGIEIIESLPSTQVSKNVWDIPTQLFRKVDVVMYSPNCWDERTVGNKHYFFMLDGCRNEGKARGFFNEFLTQELDQHRKVFEVVGAKMKTEESDKQLTGLGFSSTQRNHLICRVQGSFSRVVKVTF